MQISFDYVDRSVRLKNAILIVQFALERRRTGMAIKYSAILGAGARLPSYPDDLSGDGYRSVASDVRI